MASSVDLSFDEPAIDAAADRAVRQYLTAGTLTVASTTKRLERALEDVTRGAVPGRLWRAWKSDAYPKRGPARDPVGVVYLNGRSKGRTGGAIRFWSQPGAIRGKSGQFLAIPLPAAGSRGRARDLTPGQWERNTGQRLRFVYRPGRPSLLVADGAVLSGKAQVARPNSAGRQAKGRGSATVPIFVLLPIVPFRNAFAIAPLVAAAEAELPGAFLDAVGRLS
jgi:hypothetical protein